MNWNELVFTKKNALGYKTVDMKDRSEITHVIFTYKQYLECYNEMQDLYRKISILNNDMSNLQNDYKRESSLAHSLYEEREKFLKQAEENQKLIEETKKKDDRLEAICNSFVRQCKERSNQEKGQVPKKQHTGYSLVISNPRDYPYTFQGSRKKTILFDSIFQTPYPIDYSYEDAYELVDRDVVFGEDEDMLLDYMGADMFSEKRRYEEVLEEHKFENIDDQNVFFNQNIRMNGRDGYWELTISHTKPLSSPPSIMRFVKKRKKKNKDDEN